MDKKYDQVSAVVRIQDGMIISKIYTRHGDAENYFSRLCKYNIFNKEVYKPVRFNLVPDETYEHQKGKQ